MVRSVIFVSREGGNKGMIRKVFKYTIPIEDTFELKMPQGAEILTVQEQYDEPHIWALCDPDAPEEKRVFRLAGTGHPIRYDMGVDYKYIGTFQLHRGGFIGHLFEYKGV